MTKTTKVKHSKNREFRIVRPKTQVTCSPALVFVEWETASNTKGHFVVVGAANSSEDKYTILAPFYGLQEMVGLPFYYPDTSEADPPSLKFSGAVAFVE
jgi:hypothetical protein